MKKIILPFFAGLLTLVASGPHAHAQLQEDSGSYAKNEKPKNAAASNYNSAGDASNSTTELKNVNRRALKDFTRTFQNPTAVQWYKNEDGFIAYCTVNGIRNRCSYDKKGNWLYSACYYGEKKLPSEVRAQVKRIYYDFAITGVHEIRIPDKIIYLVYIHDDTIFKTLRVTEDEMDVLASFHQ